MSKNVKRAEQTDHQNPNSMESKMRSDEFKKGEEFARVFYGELFEPYFRELSMIAKALRGNKETRIAQRIERSVLHMRMYLGRTPEGILIQEKDTREK